MSDVNLILATGPLTTTQPLDTLNNYNDVSNKRERQQLQPSLLHLQHHPQQQLNSDRTAVPAIIQADEVPAIVSVTNNNDLIENSNIIREPAAKRLKQRQPKQQQQQAASVVAGGAQLGPKKANNEQWDSMFERLILYKKVYGDCLVPKRYAPDPKLGTWVETQRVQYKRLQRAVDEQSGVEAVTPNKRLNQERLEKLQSIGFTWSAKNLRKTKASAADKPKKLKAGPDDAAGKVAARNRLNDAQWEEMYQRLQQYKEKFGDCLVPRKYEPDPKLGAWVEAQRVLWNKDHRDCGAKTKNDGKSTVTGAVSQVEAAQTSKTSLTAQPQLQSMPTGLHAGNSGTLLDAWPVVTTCRATETSPGGATAEDAGEVAATITHLEGAMGVNITAPCKGNVVTATAAPVKEVCVDVALGDGVNERDTGICLSQEDNAAAAVSPQIRQGQVTAVATVAIEERTVVSANADEVPMEISAVSLSKSVAYEGGKSTGESRHVVIPVVERVTHDADSSSVAPVEHANTRPPVSFNLPPGDGRAAESTELSSGAGVGSDSASTTNALSDTATVVPVAVVVEAPADVRVGTLQTKQHKQPQQTVKRLSQERKNKLDQLGFVWSLRNKRIDDHWDQMFRQLLQYKDKYGDCLVPSRFEENLKLGKWVETQRYEYTKLQRAAEQLEKQSGQSGGASSSSVKARPTNPRLTEERLRRLESIGFEWKVKHKMKRYYDKQWDNMFERLLKFKEKSGHCMVPKRYPPDLKLGTWVHTQRIQHRKLMTGVLRKDSNFAEAIKADPSVADEISYRLTEDRRKRLEEVGFIWSAREGDKSSEQGRITRNSYDDQWDAMFNRLKEFKTKTGHCLVPKRFKEYPKLGTWVDTQRVQYKKMKKKLASQGLEYDGPAPLEEEVVEETPAISPKPLVGRLTDDRIRRLEGLGFVWSLRDDWQKHYDELKEYKRVYGHCNVPARYTKNRRLGIWVSAQRQQYKIMKVPVDESKPRRAAPLTQDRIDLLEELGFTWTIRSRDSIAGDSWNQRFEELKQFVLIHGHCAVPSRYPPNPELGIWVTMQRTHFRLFMELKGSGVDDPAMSSMNDERIEKLQKLNFVWVDEIYGKKESIKVMGTSENSETGDMTSGEGKLLETDNHVHTTATTMTNDVTMREASECAAI